MRAFRWRHRVVRDERGAALIMVLGVGLVLTILVTAALATSVAGYQKARGEEDWNAAMAAAYAGVDEYQSRIQNDNTYVQYRNPASTFSAGGTGSLPTGVNVNPAFGTGTAGDWATVSGSGGRSTYRYEVDNSQYSSTGVIRLRVTGKVGTATRSIVVNLKQQGFIDFLYFTKYEMQDPDLTGKPTSCNMYAWAGRASSCGTIQFGARDTVDGPLHSNDQMVICGSTFNGIVTSSSLSTPNYTKPSGCANAAFNLNAANKPDYSLPIEMPSTNLQMKRETRTDLPVDVQRPGCLYTGPTSIVFTSNGKMTVKSPWTKKTRIAGDPARSGTTPSECGSPADLASSSGATVTVPENNLIYVQNVPTSDSLDPNYYPASGSGSRPASYSSSTCSDGNGIGYPISSERVSSIATSYGCRNGDVFIQGTVHAKVTVASGNYVYITGDIKYQDADADVLGLVGENAVWVWNPIDRYDDSLLGNSGRNISAAILSVNHTFQVQNYDEGGWRHTLAINGAIAQKYRGPVGTGGSSGHVTTGYDKAYTYDSRFRYIAPPKFLSPVSTTYGVSVLVETKSAFTSTGAVVP